MDMRLPSHYKTCNNLGRHRLSGPTGKAAGRGEIFVRPDLNVSFHPKRTVRSEKPANFEEPLSAIIGRSEFQEATNMMRDKNQKERQHPIIVRRPVSIFFQH